MKDEIREKRSQKKIAEGFKSAYEGLSEAQGTIEIAEWIQQNMPYEEFRHQAHSISMSMIGSVIGAWFDAGADRDQVKEYLSRFTDHVWDQYQKML